MKLLIAIFSILIANLSFSQKQILSGVSIDSGKNEFKRQAKKDTSDYNEAYRILKKEVESNPNNAELHYFLGYTIDRLNADDGKGMYLLKKELTLKASEQFETVNKLEPTYKGETYILDPYAKLSSVWGSLAEAYLNRKLFDSAQWAFNEGKKRGGFIEPILTFNRQLLNSCDKNSILITYGDNITIPIWYLQTIENYRTDITVIDGNLTGTIWYPKYLKNERHLKIGFSDAAIDTINYLEWQTQDVIVVNPKDTTQQFSWKLGPSYLNGYILKGDRILLDVVQQNFYNRPIYFTNNSDSSYNLYLTPYLFNEGLVDRLKSKIPDYAKEPIHVSENLNRYTIDDIKKEDIAKSNDAIVVLNYLRWAYIYNINSQVKQGNYELAKALIKQMDAKFNKNKLPFTSKEMEQNFIDFFKQIDKDYR